MGNKKEVVFNMFIGVDEPVLRAWNQLQFALNLTKDHNDKVSSQYFEMLSMQERTNVMAVATRIVVKGEDFVRKEVMQAQGK
jgi:hypothetical protein